MGSAKRRFGVSLPRDLADTLDALATVLGVERSTVVEEAIRHYLDDHRHLLIKHHCRGVIAALCPQDADASRVVKTYRSIIAAHFHIHLDGICVDIIAVSGDSGEIARVLGSLKAEGCTARYIPAGEGAGRD